MDVMSMHMFMFGEVEMCMQENCLQENMHVNKSDADSGPSDIGMRYDVKSILRV